MKIKAPFKRGDRVTTKYIKNEDGILRYVKYIFESVNFGSGWAVYSGLVERCPHCKREYGTEIQHALDSSWFKKVK